MAPIKSSLARSVGKFLGVYRNDDLVLNSSVISNRFISGQTDFITGSGGVVSAGISSDGYKYHTFVSPGSFTWTGGNEESAIEFLIVGGGGAGGWGRIAGGGGAGQVLQSINYAIPSSEPSTISITVGTGGDITTNTPQTPGNGNNTTVSHPTGIVTALGGGAGGTDLSYPSSPNYVVGISTNVASHGGYRGNEPLLDGTFPSPVWPQYHGFGGASNNVYPYASVGMSTSNIAAHGSAPASLGVSQVSGCGGGGAFGAGIQGGNNNGDFTSFPTQYQLPNGMYAKADSVTSCHAGAGGDGLRLHTYRADNILPPSSPLYTALNEISGYYGGGGGGGHASPYPNDISARNPGGRGGGASGAGEPNTPTVPGMNGTGGGGGGGGKGPSTPTQDGGASPGGDGICVIRYKENVSQVSGGSIFNDSSSTFHLFTESGMFDVPSTDPHIGDSFNVLVVGGGGGGGTYNGSGGGAGGRVTASGTLTAGRMAVVVGNGGHHAIDFWSNRPQGSPGNNLIRGPRACNGEDSFLLNSDSVGLPAASYIAGGGGFGGCNSPDRDGGNGNQHPSPYSGSGGGASDGGTGGSGHTSGGNAPSTPNAGGGGGGSSGAGSNASNNAGGNGGAGDKTPWIPTNLPALFGQPGPSPGMWHCGGGGGGARPGGSGGTGGGHPTEGSGYAGAGAGRASVPDYSAVATLHAKYASGGGGGGGVGGTDVINPSPTYLTFANGIGGHGSPGVVVIQYTT